MKNNQILLFILAIVLFSCEVNTFDNQFKNDLIENSYWRFKSEKPDPFSFSYNELSNGIIVKFNEGQTVNVLNYSHIIEDESQYLSNKDTLSYLMVEANHKAYVINKIKKISKTKYVGKGSLYNITYTSSNSNSKMTKTRKLECTFDVVGQRLIQKDAESFKNQMYERPKEILSKTKWKLFVSAPYDPKSTWQSQIGLKDTVLNVEFKWYHGVYLPGYYYSSVESDSIRWIGTNRVSDAINACYWYQTSDTSFIFNVGFNSLNPRQSMKFSGVIVGSQIKGTCTAYDTYKYHPFRGVKL